MDRGIATAADFGVYGPQGDWLIEGHGVEPDVAVGNLPHATFLGKDAQLEAAVALLQDKICREPVTVPVPIPKFPVKVEPVPEEPTRQNRGRRGSSASRGRRYTRIASLKPSPIA